MRTRVINLSFVVLVALLPVVHEAPAARAADVANRPLAPDIERYFTSFRNEHGRAPTDSEYAEFSAKAGGLSNEDRARGWYEWPKEQRPSISAGSLQKLLRAQRASVSSAVLKYNFSQESKESDGSWTTELDEDVKWFMSHNKLRLDVRNRKPGGAPEARWAYDGKVVRSVTAQAEAGWIGEISRFRGRGRFYEMQSPWTQEMLTNAQADLGLELRVYDLVLMLDDLAVVSEGTEQADGRNCIVVTYGLGGPPLFRALLDPGMNYAVVRFEEYLVTAGTAEQPASRSLEYLRTATGFKNRGGGIWLPDSISETWYNRHGQLPGPADGVTMRSKIALAAADINQDVDQKMFGEALFAKSILVHDDFTDESVIAGQTSSVPAILDRGIDEARGLARPTNTPTTAPSNHE